MKKSTTRSTKLAKAAATAASTLTADKPVRPPVAPIAPAEPAVKPAPKTPAKKPAPKATSTSVVALIDVGFGNTLYIRGEGPGLSWDRGLPMECSAEDRWTITVSDASVPVIFKLLLNDITWCSGSDFVVEPGASITVTPSF